MLIHKRLDILVVPELLGCDYGTICVVCVKWGTHRSGTTIHTVAFTIVSATMFIRHLHGDEILMSVKNHLQARLALRGRAQRKEPVADQTSRAHNSLARLPTKDLCCQLPPANSQSCGVCWPRELASWISPFFSLRYSFSSHCRPPGVCTRAWFLLHKAAFVASLSARALRRSSSLACTASKIPPRPPENQVAPQSTNATTPARRARSSSFLGSETGRRVRWLHLQGGGAKIRRLRFTQIKS